MYKCTFFTLLLASCMWSVSPAQISKNADKEDIRQISLILDKIERGVQQQRSDWIESTMCYDSTESTMTREVARNKVNQNFELLKTSVQKRDLKANIPLVNNMEDFTLKLKKIDISKDQNKAVVEFEASFVFAEEDSTYYLSLPVNVRDNISTKGKEHLLKYQPITLELLKKDHN